MKNNNENENDISIRENFLIEESIKWILRIRWGILSIFTILFLALNKEASNLLLFIISISFITAISAFIIPKLKFAKRHLETFLLFQIIIDILLFSVNIHYYPNYQTIFSFVYIVPIIIASVILSTNLALALAFLSSLLYIYAIFSPTENFTSLKIIDLISKTILFHISAFLTGFISNISIKYKENLLLDKNKKNKEELSKAQKHIIENKKELQSTYEQLNCHIQEIESTNKQVTKLYDEMEKSNLQISNKVKALSILHEVGNAINSVHDLNKLLNFIIICATEELHAENGSIMILNKNKSELEIKVAKGLEKETINSTHVKIGEGISGWVAQTGEPLLINNIEEDPRFSSINRSKYHTNSLLSVPLRIKNKIIGVINLNNKESNKDFTQDDLEFLMTLANHAAISIENAQLYKNIRKSYFDTISALAMTIEAKDPHTRGHSKRVTEYAVSVAKKIKLHPSRIEVMRYSAMLHDIGKIGISEEIIFKKNNLSREELLIIRNHPLIGESIIEPIDFLQSVKPIIRYHHERFDGNGYPDGISGEEIPIEARILSIADSYDAMTSDRPYRNKLSHQEALSEVVRNSGTQFDPYLKDTFIGIF